MAYTHYWDQLRDFTTDEWNLIKDASRRFLEKAEEEEISIKGPMGIGRPRVNNQLIALNGDDSLGEALEAFILFKRRQEDATLNCTTRRKPYDIVVTSILSYANRLAPDAIEISSDGGPEAFQLVYSRRIGNYMYSSFVDFISFSDYDWSDKREIAEAIADYGREVVSGRAPLDLQGIKEQLDLWPDAARYIEDYDPPQSFLVELENNWPNLFIKEGF